eukprot:m.205323 g.205323  ORF g.205323 m.205323 type:complete len:222 (-) comp32910_c0_seq1:34-699(-)
MASLATEGQFPVHMLQRLNRSRVVAGFSVEKVEHAVPLARALLAGGIDVIELTLRTDAGLAAIKAICEQVPEMLVGVGTILTPSQAQEVKNAGAAFGVSPGMNPNTIKAAQAVGLPFAPGICTPSELEQSIELGCRFVKFFPAEASGGVNFLKSMAAPYAHLGIKYFPLGGVNEDNMKTYLSRNDVIAVGGSWIVKADLVRDGNWGEITARAKAVVTAFEK